MAGGQVQGVAAFGGNLSRDRLSKEMRVVGQPLQRWRQFTKKQNDYGAHQGQLLIYNKRKNASADASTGLIVAERGIIPSTDYEVLQGTCTAQTSAVKIPWTGELELYAEFDLDKENRDALTDLMAKGLNYRAYDKFWATDICYIPTGGGTPAATWDVDGVPSTAADRNITLFDLKNVVDALKKGKFGSNASQPVLPYDGANYQQVASVDAARALRDDDDWEEAARFGDPERLWAAEIGRIYMTRTVEDNFILDTNNSYKGESVIFGKDAVMECVAQPEEIRLEIPQNLQMDKAIGFVYCGGFDTIWGADFANEGFATIVKITSS
jgi:hypothetical protein